MEVAPQRKHNVILREDGNLRIGVTTISIIDEDINFFRWGEYHAPHLDKCFQHYEHKGDTRVTLVTCGAIGERAQVSLVWVRALETSPIYRN